MDYESKGQTWWLHIDGENRIVCAAATCREASMLRPRESEGERVIEVAEVSHTESKSIADVEVSAAGYAHTATGKDGVSATVLPVSRRVSLTEPNGEQVTADLEAVLLALKSAGLMEYQSVVEVGTAEHIASALRRRADTERGYKYASPGDLRFADLLDRAARALMPTTDTEHQSKDRFADRLAHESEKMAAAFLKEHTECNSMPRHDVADGLKIAARPLRAAGLPANADWLLHLEGELSARDTECRSTDLAQHLAAALRDPNHAHDCSLRGRPGIDDDRGQCDCWVSKARDALASAMDCGSVDGGEC